MHPGPVDGRGRSVLVAAFAALALDALVILTVLVDYHAYLAAPTNASLAPEDDPNYFLAGLAYAGSSLLRDLAVVGLVAAIMAWRLGERRRVGVAARPASLLWVATSIGLVGVEGVAIAVTWSAPEPTALTCGCKIAACVVNAAVSAALVRGLLRRSTVRGRWVVDEA